MTQNIPQSTQERRNRLLQLLSDLYGVRTAGDTAQRLWQRLEASPGVSSTPRNDCMLITYGDTLLKADEVPLQVLHTFLQNHLSDVCGRVHLLPFYPSSSDDGFAVIDYRMVDHHVGGWTDVEAIAADFDVMFDLVINHCSRENLWFADFVSGRAPGKNYFITLPEESDTSAVARPRSTPLISAIHTYEGIRHVWNTFSDDQIDLDFSNPDVLLEFVDIMLFYVERGAALLRLDAVGYLWKRLGSSCLNLPEAHVAVKILRLLLDEVAPDVKIITETNVPHVENVAYFGDGDEADLVYQFSLPPLLLYSFVFGDSQYLQTWAQQLDTPPAGKTYLNFIASHDGIGLRPLEGLVPEAEVDRLVDAMHERGGFMTLRTVRGSKQRPYEINVSLMSAFGGEVGLPAYLAAHGLMLSFQGSPAIYVHSFLGTLNDIEGVEQTGRTRSINRRKWDVEELNSLLADPISLQAQALAGVSALVKKRNQLSAFDAQAEQKVVVSDTRLFVLQRHSRDQSINVVCNLSSETITIERAALELTEEQLFCHIAQTDLASASHLQVAPWQLYWLEEK